MALDFTTSFIKLNNQYTIVGNVADVDITIVPKKGELYFMPETDGERTCKIGDGNTQLQHLPVIGVSKLSLEDTSEAENINLEYNGKYKLNVGNKNIVFKMPPSIDPNEFTDTFQAADYNTGLKIATGNNTPDLYVPTGTSSNTVALGNHTHNITASATDGMFNLTGTNGTDAVTYAVAPYSDTTATSSWIKTDANAGKFYSGSNANPSKTTRLNYNGYLYATKLYSGGTEVSVTGHNHSYAGSATAGGPATRVKSTDITSSAGVLTLISDGAGATAFDITATKGITPITGGPTLDRYAQGIVTSDSTHEGTLLAVNSSGTPYCGFISNNNGTATWSSLKQILTVGDEQYARYKSADVSTAGWYRIYTSEGGSGCGKDNILVTLGHNYYTKQSEDYSFMISVGYRGDIQITQLSGVSGGNTITKLRVVTNNSEVAFIDFYKTGSTVDTYYVGGIGAGTFCAPTSCTGDMAADEPACYYTKTVTVGASFRVNGSLYAGGTAVTLNGSSKAGATASLYAPTGAGTSGYILKSNGSGAPTWLQTLPIANGGTGATTADAARKNLGAASSEHTHTTLVGTYTQTDGGRVAPSYVGNNAIKCNMMSGFLDTSGGTLTSFNYYADVLMMNAYVGADVPYVTALAINKNDGEPRAWIANGGSKNAKGWRAAAELWTNANLTFSLSGTTLTIKTT